MTPSAKKEFFPNLDGVRGMAALCVVIWHTEIHKVLYGFQQYLNLDTGYIGVSIFLVLSGFLITYLLLQEREVKKSIDYKSFYLRRVLRIWPLYFLVLFVGYFIYPANLSFPTLLYCIFFMPNIAFVLHMLPYIIDPIWTIGVEEQFYLIQPHLLRVKKPRNLLWLFLGLFALIYLLKVLSAILPQTPAVLLLKDCLYFFRVENLVLGSLAALLYYNEKHQIFSTGFSIKLLFHKYVQVLAYLMFASYLFLKPAHPALMNKELFSVVVTLLILNLANTETSILSLQNRVMSYMGKISYGFYLLHKFPLFLVLFLAKKYGQGLPALPLNIIIYILILGSSVLLASLSYTYYETYFLKLKARFADWSR